MKKRLKTVIAISLVALAIVVVLLVMLRTGKVNSINNIPANNIPAPANQELNQEGAADKAAESDAPVQMANPASVNCSRVGGRLVIEKRGDGGEYGLCYFEDNRACEEWALFRGDCPVGGRKTTGFDTISQKYCAWLGGDTLAEPQSVCTLKDGSKCSTEDFYNGKCPASN